MISLNLILRPKNRGITMKVSARPRGCGDPGFAAKTRFPRLRERTAHVSMSNTYARSNYAAAFAVASC
jgi:hypothetical protein